jgi:prepilin signal peptidase PulO-like enzyme (type II secretory pathway)
MRLVEMMYLVTAVLLAMGVYMLVGAGAFLFGFADIRHMHNAEQTLYMGMLVASIIYLAVKSVLSKEAIGYIQIVVAAASNIYQIHTLVHEQTQMGIVDRLTFIVAGIALFASGLEKIVAGD